MSIKSQVVQNEQKELLFQMSQVPEFFQRKCEVELNETDKKKKLSIQELKELLKNDKVTKSICFHDDFLVQYLRHNKYNTNKAFNHLRKFINFRNKEEKMFESFPDDFYLKTPSMKVLSILPKRSPDGCTVVLGQVGKLNTNELSIEEVKRVFLITFIQLFRDPMTQINGIKAVYDFAGTGSEHLRIATPQNIYLLYYVAICCIPGRYKEVHFINETPVIRFIWSIIKIFLSVKIRNRVFFHSDTSELLNHFPKSVIPVEYGGELQDIYATNFVQTAIKEQRENTAAGQPNFY